MKIHLLLAISILCMIGCATTPQLTNQYQTLGYNVSEYSDGYENYYEVFDSSGNIAVRANMLGFINWKRGRLLELIGNENTTHADRERYKLEYEDIARRLDIYQAYRLQTAPKFQAPTVQSRAVNLCSSTSKNCFRT